MIAGLLEIQQAYQQNNRQNDYWYVEHQYSIIADEFFLGILKMSLMLEHWSDEVLER